MLSVFQAIDEYYHEVEVATKAKSESEDVLSYMIRTRERQAVDKVQVVARLLTGRNVPLSPSTAVGLIETWFCDPEVLARAFDRLLQFPDKPLELIAEEKVIEEGAAKPGPVDVESCQDELGTAIAGAITSIAKTDGGAAVLWRLAFFFGGKGYVGKQIDKVSYCENFAN